MTLTSTVEMENQFEQFDILKLYLNIHISSINEICLKLYDKKQSLKMKEKHLNTGLSYIWSRHS